MAGSTKRGGQRRKVGDKSRLPSSDGAAGDDGFATRQDVADYIASMLEAMRDLADKKDLAFLSYLMGIALEEAKAEKGKEG